MVAYQRSTQRQVEPWGSTLERVAGSLAYHQKSALKRYQKVLKHGYPTDSLWTTCDLQRVNIQSTGYLPHSWEGGKTGLSVLFTWREWYAGHLGSPPLHLSCTPCCDCTGNWATCPLGGGLSAQQVWMGQRGRAVCAVGRGTWQPVHWSGELGCCSPTCPHGMWLIVL